MSNDPVTLDIQDSIARINFNRPDSLNAINTEAVIKLHEIVNKLYSNNKVRVVILSGSGDKAFCAGGDVSEFSQAGDSIDQMVREMTSYLHVSISRLAWLNAPVIARVNGVAAGAGLSFVACCDLAISINSATFTSAYTKIGFTPDGSSTFFLPRLIGRKRVLELYLTNRVLSAEEALEWGLINQVTNGQDLDLETDKLAQTLARGPTKAFGGIKKLVMMSPNDSLESQMERETRYIAEMTVSKDGLEGVTAFVEKRKPNFTGE